MTYLRAYTVQQLKVFRAFGWTSRGLYADVRPAMSGKEGGPVASAGIIAESAPC